MRAILRDAKVGDGGNDATDFHLRSQFAQTTCRIRQEKRSQGSAGKWNFVIVNHEAIGSVDAFSHLYKRVWPSVGPSVDRSLRHIRVEFLRKGPNLNKIASEIRRNAI